MGDRGNIVIKVNRAPDLYLYTHWQGHMLPKILQKALIRGEDRWDDPPYLARIIFCELIKGRDIEELTGYGIGTYLSDNENPLVYVDTNKQEVIIDKNIWTFEEFCSLVLPIE